MYLQKAWEQAVRFHSSPCPALAIGARATAHVMEYFSLSETGPYDVVCTAESFSCAIDAIQAVLGCTIGNGKLRVQSKRRMAFRFCDKRTGRGVSLSLRPWLRDRPGLTEKLLTMPLEKLFQITVSDEVAEKAPNCILSSACPVRNPRPGDDPMPFELPEEEGGGAMAFRFDHFNFNVLNLEKSLAFYKDAFGLEPVRTRDAEDGSFKLVYLGDRTTGFQLELTWLRDRTEPYNLGELEYHLALRTADYEAARAKHQEMGVICFENPGMGIYFVSDPDGYWIEVVPER